MMKIYAALSIIVVVSITLFIVNSSSQSDVDRSQRNLLEVNTTTNVFNGGLLCFQNYQCSSPQGFCENNICVCYNDFSGEDCSVRRKRQLTAFVLSIFFGVFAADRFYLGWTAMAIGKLILGLNSIVFGCFILPIALLCGVVTSNEDFCFSFLRILKALAVLAWAGWWLADWIMILTGDLIDYDGYGLVQEI